MTAQVKRSKMYGRRMAFTWVLAEQYLTRLAEGETSTSICKDHWMPSRTTVWQWARDNEEFAEHLKIARLMQAEAGFEEIQDLADALGREERKKDESLTLVPTNEEISAAKLRVNSRMFRVARLNAALYGDKRSVAVEGGGTNSPPIQLDIAPTTDELKQTVSILAEVFDAEAKRIESGDEVLVDDIA